MFKNNNNNRKERKIIFIIFVDFVVKKLKNRMNDFAYPVIGVICYIVAQLTIYCLLEFVYWVYLHLKAFHVWYFPPKPYQVFNTDTIISEVTSYFILIFYFISWVINEFYFIWVLILWLFFLYKISGCIKTVNMYESYEKRRLKKIRRAARRGNKDNSDYFNR